MSVENFRLTVEGFSGTNVEPVFRKTVDVEQKSLSKKAQSLVASAIGASADEIVVYLMEMRDQ